MKKPNITEGPWKADADLKSHTDWTIRSKDWINSDLMGDYRGCIIADLKPSHGGRKHAFEEARANAKAIEEVPGMIDALIEAHEYLRTLPAHTRNNMGVKATHIFLKIEESLKKAGVEEL